MSLANARPALSRRITGVSSMAMRLVLAELAQMYEQRTERGVAIQSMGGVAAAQRVRDGEQTDVVILASNFLKALEAEGHVVAGSRVDLARSGIAVAIRAGAPQPDLADAERVKQAMLNARRVCYSSGPSGDHLKALWTRWGIVDFVEPRALQAPPGVPVGTLVARGDADLGVQQLSELLPIDGIDVLDALPPDVQSETVFSAGLCATSQNSDEARALLAYLAAPEADGVKRRHGMEPA